jgi:hypothetical protein
VYYQDITLPVTLLSITANNQADAVQLKWDVAAETNFSHYEIERSSDARNFYNIGRVASPASWQKQKYSFVDKAPLNKNFYRLKMVDIDGRYEYSKIVSASVDNNTSAIRLFPNPAKDVIKLYFSNNDPGIYSMQLINHLGQVVATKKMRVVTANQVEAFNGIRVPGLYRVNIFNSKQHLIKTLPLVIR